MDAPRQAYPTLVPIFRLLAGITKRFEEARRSLRKLPGTSDVEVWSNFSQYPAETGGSGTDWEIELSAQRSGTIARWNLRIDLEDDPATCEVLAEAGFQGKFGPTEVREVESTMDIVSMQDLESATRTMLDELFRDLEGDIQAAIRADLEERARYS